MESVSLPPVAGTVIFSTVGRASYGFDVFSLSLLDPSAPERRLTDGTSINFNGHFADDNQTLAFISERTGAPRIYLTRSGSSNPPEQLPYAPGSLFHDRPILSLRDGRVFFISAHEPADSLYKSWSALYSAPIGGAENITRLTPNGVVDYSPAISQSGDLIAVASYGSKPWGGEFHELDTEIVVFPLSDPAKRTVVAKRGGWPSWCGDSTIYFHRQSDDGWWSVYRVDFPGAQPPIRVTPPGLHAFTPAAMNNGKSVAVATRRKERAYRHIEIFDVESGKFQPVTEALNPQTHHYNPFVSPGSKFLGYHRFRGFSDVGEKIVPNLEPVISPIKSLKMLRINGSFPSFSPDGDLIAYNHEFGPSGEIKIVKSDGSKRWTLIKGQLSFYNSWNPADKNVIFVGSQGPKTQRKD